MNAEIHFHQQDQASVFLETTVSGNEEKFAEILLFCCFAIRQMVNFGRDPAAFAIARLLDYASTALKEVADHQSPDEAKLVEYKGSPGRKRFVARVTCTDDRLGFILKPKGFGLLGRGMGYYGPDSVTLLLKYLVKKRNGDDEFIGKLAAAAAMCAQAYSQGQVSLATQSQIAMMVAATTAGNYLE